MTGQLDTYDIHIYTTVQKKLAAPYKIHDILSTTRNYTRAVHRV